MKAFVPITWLTCATLVLTALTTRAGSFSSDFNSGLPSGTTLLSNAFVDSSGGPDGSGCLKLTLAANSTSGGILLDDLDNNVCIQTFTATFNVHMGNGTAQPADGFSFNFGAPPIDATFGEQGEAYAGYPGLTVGFDAFDNGTQDDQQGPEVVVRFYPGVGSANQLIARRKLTNQLKTGAGYVPFSISYNVGGTLDVYINGAPIFTNLFISGTTIAGWRFSLCARTGGAYQEHWIDDLNITTVTQPTYRHYVKGVYPLANNSLANVTNAIVQIPLQNEVDTSLTTMTFNGVQVPISWTGVGTGKPIATYDPQGLPPGSINTATLNIVDTNGPTETMTWTFSVTNQALWTIAPNTRAWLGANEGTTPYTRSIAYSAVSNQLYVASRHNGSNTIAVLDPDTGVDKYYLNTTGINTGSIPLLSVAVADDGAVYACNLYTATGGNNFIIYSWPTPDDSTPPTIVFNSTPPSSARWGDSLAARGFGADTLLIADAQNVANSALFYTDSSMQFSSSLLIHTNTGTVIGRGLCFGPDNTFFLKKKSSTTTGQPLVQMTCYSSSPGDQSYTSTVDSVGDYHYALGATTVDYSNRIAAGVFFASATTSYDRLYLYDISSFDNPLQVATYYTNVTATANGGSEQCYIFPVTHVANGNYIAQVVIGGGKVFAIDANNGIIAVPEFPPEKTVIVAPQPQKMTVDSKNGAIVISWPDKGAGEVLQSNPSLAPANWTSTGLTPVTAYGTNTVTIIPSGANYYRLAR